MKNEASLQMLRFNSIGRTFSVKYNLLKLQQFLQSARPTSVIMTNKKLQTFLVSNFIDDDIETKYACTLRSFVPIPNWTDVDTGCFRNQFAGSPVVRYTYILRVDDTWTSSNTTGTFHKRMWVNWLNEFVSVSIFIPALALPSKGKNNNEETGNSSK
jgi:hypothetical protein